MKVITPLIEKDLYKNCPPEETIHRIREILHKTGIFVTETSGYDCGFYHSHLCISNDDLQQFNLMTNGKGRSPEYALASAYSEMMERLQNGYKFYGTRFASEEFMSSFGDNSEYVMRMRKAKAELRYTSFVDEKKYSLREYLLSKDCIFSQQQKEYILEHGDSYLLDEFLVNCVPYYDIFNRETKYLPADCFTSGSNGMCAGNTPAEALVQGLCELFERYALKMVMLNDAIPPQIPMSYFEGTDIYNKIINLDNTRVVVLDCSFSMRLPVIGAVVINTTDDTYCLEMAGATTATIALERCMTEHFQDGNPNESMSSVFKDGVNSVEEKYHQFYSQSKGFGELDIKHLLFGEHDYQFNGFYSIPGDTSEEELSYIVNEVLKPNGLNCYIRDNSILGFPSYHIYIPEISDIYDICNDNDLYLTFKALSLQSGILDLKHQSKEKLRAICETSVMLSQFTRSSNIPLYANHLYNIYIKQEKPDNDLLLAIIFLQINDVEASIKLLEKFVSKINTTEDKDAKRYYNCVLDFLKLSKKTKTAEKTKHLLSTLYNKDLVDEVISDVLSVDKLQYYDWPTCFHCEKCRVKESCKYPDAMAIVRRIQDNTILTNQDDIISIMNTLTGESRKSNKE